MPVKHKRLRAAAHVSLLSVLVVGLMVGYTTRLTSASGTAQLALSPVSETVTPGSTFTVSLVVTTNGANVGQVQAGLAYPTNLLTCVSIGAPSDFGSTNSNDQCSNGTISVNRSRSQHVATSNGTVVTVQFQAVGNGTAAVDFTFANAGGQAAATTNSTYVVGRPSSSPGSGSAPSAGSSGGSAAQPATATAGSSQAAGTTPAPPGAPVISNIQVLQQSGPQATVSWQTDQPASSIVGYSFDKSYKYLAGSYELATQHSVKLDPAALGMGLTYYVKLTSQTANGLSRTALTSFRITGFTVKLRVYDQYEKVLSGATVYLGNSKKTTDKNGYVTFTDVDYGKQTVKIVYEGKQQTKPIATGQTNKDGKIIPVVSYNLVADKLQARAPNSSVIEVLIGGIIAFIIVMVLLFIKLLHSGDPPAAPKDPDLYYPGQPQPPITPQS